MPDDRFVLGTKVRRGVLGDAQVDASDERTTAFNGDFQRFITEVAWGSVWTRPGRDRPTRSMLVIALMAALGHEEELALHLRATKNTGATFEDVQEALLMVAVYAGVPAANAAIRTAKEVFAAESERMP